jgi:hypothetical protein
VKELRSAVVALAVLAACGSDGPEVATERADPSTTSTDDRRAPEPSTTATSTTQPPVTTPRPDWLGTRVLPIGPDGLGEVQPTPPELADRRFATIDVLPPPTDESWAPATAAVPDEVLARSTWTPDCPVRRDELRYLTLPFWGFDQRLHTGELIVHADVVDHVTAGFRRLFERRFPIEEMRVTRAEEMDAPPTGDGNNTGAFVCRPSVRSTRWSQHAYGRAVDINPFHNPYVRDDLVIPELASVYADRSVQRPGMLVADDVAGFVEAGWGWGGSWSSVKDWMHLSEDGS